MGEKGGCVWKAGCLRITKGICVEAGEDYPRRAECELYECALGSWLGWHWIMSGMEECGLKHITDRLIREGC